MIDLAILGLLRTRPHHGYEVKRLLADLGFPRVSFGSLYPAFRRLERLGLIAAERPSGRRKTYRITAEGRDELVRRLSDQNDPLEENRAFQLRVAFFGFLEPERRLDLLERRRAALVDHLQSSRRTLERAGRRIKDTVDRYAIALMEHTVRSTEADIAWLDELIAAERSRRHGGLPPPIPPLPGGSP